MSRILTICVPTYNRAAELDHQLAWVAKEVRGLGDAVEVIVSDNASSDDTAAVVQRWSTEFDDVPFASQRHPENLGWMRNFHSCYERAAGRYCWVIGDDDTVYDGSVRFVLDTLRADPELTLFYLNFLGRAADTGEVIGDHWFDPAVSEWARSDGLHIYQHSIERHFGSVIFVTSAVIRTDLALEGIAQWPACLDNWGGMAYWCAHAALQGHVYVTPENFVECLLGQSYWQKDPLAWFRIRHRDIPDVYRHMRGIGYERGFCARKILKILQEDVASKDAGRNLKDYWRALRERPLWTLGVLGSYFGSLARVLVSR